MILTSLAILIFVVSIAVMFIGTQAIQKNEPLFIFGYSFSIVPTDSMIGDEPDSLDPFDIAIIKKSSYEDVKIGDVIVFQSEINGMPKLFIHRVVGYHHLGGFETQGDHNSSVDLKPVTQDNYQAMYVSKITFLKPIAQIASNQKNLIFGVLSLVLLGMVISETIRIIKMVKVKEEAKVKKEKEDLLKEKLYQEVLEEEKSKLKKNT